MRKFIILLGILITVVGGFVLFKFITKPVHVTVISSDNKFLTIISESEPIEYETETEDVSVESDVLETDSMETESLSEDIGDVVSVEEETEVVDNSVENVDNLVPETTVSVAMPTPSSIQWIQIGNVKVSLDTVFQYDSQTSNAMMSDPSITLFLQQFAEYKAENKIVMFGFSVAGKENDVESFMTTVENYLFGEESDYERTFEEELDINGFKGYKHTFLSSDRTNCNIVYGCYTGQGIFYLVGHFLYDINSDADFNRIIASLTSA